jgi:hypothetical protein
MSRDKNYLKLFRSEDYGWGQVTIDLNGFDDVDDLTECLGKYFTAGYSFGTSAGTKVLEFLKQLARAMTDDEAAEVAP